MSGIGTPYVPSPELLAGVTLSGAHTKTVATLTTVQALTKVPQSGIVLVENELILVAAFNNSSGHHFTGCTRGAYGTTGAAHADTTPVYEVMAVVKKGGGVEVYFFNSASSGQLQTKFIPKFGASLTLEVAGNGTDALPANLTDSTTGVVSVTTPPTLIAVRTDTVANAAADIIKNFATLNAHVNLLAAYVAGLEVTTEA